jgi:purine-binding chemotaxis protein CheW
MTGRDIDWAGLRERVEAAGRSLQRDGGPDEEGTRELLAQRARDLARPVTTPTPEGKLPLVRFSLGGETWGLDARYAWDVFHLSELALLPGSGPPVVGLTPWRGTILTLFDLRPLLGMQAEGLSNLDHVIVVGEARPELGVLADAVEELIGVDPRDVGPLPEGAAGSRDLVMGVTKDALLVLDARALLLRYAPGRGEEKMAEQRSPLARAGGSRGAHTVREGNPKLEQGDG